MDADKRKEAHRIFEAALDEPDAARDAFVADACTDDPELLREVAALLAADQASDDFLAAPMVRHGFSLETTPPVRDLTDARIDNYRVLKKIGEGGMSEVWLAVRADDEYQKRVALKLIRHDLDREDLLSRFRTERQILASLDHPNIAKLLDGGTTEEGLPYFVMDFIEGVPITEYCDRHRLAVRKRLDLFRTVCGAVQYAHQNLVVHRDIKASNILVTSDDQVRLLDFGIAKLLRPDQFAQPIEYTMTSMRPMTPHYASPEQIRGELVGTQSDVYSLGVLLYKLLTGHLPFLSSGGPTNEFERQVLEQEPDRPSTAVAKTEPGTDEGGGPTTAPTPDDVGRARDTHPAQLRRQLEGDLDNIILMALRKEPQRRYASAEQFAEDVRKYCHGLPVLARKDTFRYRSSKFLRRNRLAVTGGAAFVLLLIGFLTVLSVQSARVARERDQARLERDRAEEVVGFLEGIFEASDPFEKGEELTARELLGRSADRVTRDLAGQPLLQGSLMSSIGKVHARLSLNERAGELLETALDLRRTALGEDHPDVAATMTELGQLRRLEGDFDAAEPLLQRALEIRRQTLGEWHHDTLESMYGLAQLMENMGRLEEGEELLRRALALHLEHGSEDPLLGRLKSDLGIVLNRAGRMDEAETVFRETLEMRRRMYRGDHALVAEDLNNLGVCLGMKGQLDEAEPMFREALEIRRRILGNDHTAIAEGVNNLARLLVEQGNLEEAEELYREALEIWRRKLGDEHPRVAILTHNLGRLLYDRQDFAAAEAAFREALEIRQRLLPTGHYDLAESRVAIGKVVMDTGRPAEAEPWLREGLEGLRTALAADHWRIDRARALLGACLGRLGRYEEGETLLVDGYEGLAAKRGAEHRYAQEARRRVEFFYDSWGRPERERTFDGPTGK